jgi:hypothetical protein
MSNVLRRRRRRRRRRRKAVPIEPMLLVSAHR